MRSMNDLWVIYINRVRLLASVALHLTSSTMVQASWKKLAATAAIQRSSQTLAVIADKAYIYGGELRPREPVDSDVYAFRLDPGRSFDLSLPYHPSPACPVSRLMYRAGTPNTRVSPISLSTSFKPQPRVGAASTALNGKLYIFSGRGGGAMAPIEELGSFWVLDPSSNSWSQLTPKDPVAPFPAGRSYHAVTNDGDDTIFLHAGCPEKGRLSDLWAFCVSARQWQELLPAPDPPRGGTSIAYAEAKLFRMNGFDGRTEQGGALDIFDRANSSWSTVTYKADGVSGPAPRSVSCLLPVKVEGRWTLLTIFGERDPSSLGHQGAGKMLADSWIFDIETEVWKELQIDGDGRPAARGWFDADVVDDDTRGCIVVHGGLGESNERLDDIWLLQL
jgi:hypothetical protein